MSCPDASELQAFLDGSLSAEQAAAIEEHMDGCAGCRKTVSTLAKQLARTVDAATAQGDAPLEALRGGQRVDHFEILELLGRGGMGRVYLARDTQLDRMVALKVLHAAPDEPARLEQLLHEARTTARFNHPNIVTIHQVGEVQGRLYLALEHLEGQTLQQRIKTHAAPPMDEALQVGLAVARALTEAHASGVLHRDLKPSNVMIVGDDFDGARVLDFGLAFSEDPPAADADESHLRSSRDGASSLGDAGAIRGTPAYMAPEQWNAEEVTSAADVWALGVILYELSSGKRPFEGRSLVQQALLVNADEPAPPLPPQVPEGLGALIERCLSRRPGRRPSAAEVLQQLERIHARLRGARARRRRGIAVFVALALLALGALAAALVIDSQKREAQRQRAEAQARQAEAQQQRAEALREGARRALINGDLLEARARLRVALELEDSVDARVLWWRLSQDPLRWKQRFAATVNAAAYVPDGTQIAVAARDAVHLLDAQTGARRQTLQGHRDRVMTLSPSPDGARLATGSWDGEVRLWELRSGRGSVLAAGGRQAAVYSVRFSPDGRRLAAACRDHAVRIWDLQSRSLERRLTCTGPVLDVRFSPKGEQVVAGTKAGQVYIWDRASGTRLPGPAAGAAAVMSLALDPRGALLVSGSMDGALNLWDLSSRSPRPAIALPFGATSVALGPSRGGAEQPTLLAAGLGDGSVWLWRLQAQGVTAAGRYLGHQGTVWELSFSPDGAALVSGGVDRTVRSWRIGARPRPRPASHGGAVLGVDFSLDNKQVATGGRDGAVRLWRAWDGKLQRTLRGHTSAVWGVAFSPKGKQLATGGGDGGIRIWDSTGRLLRTLSGHGGSVWDLRFSADGALLASASADRTVRLWDAASGRQRALLSGHEGGVRSVRFSPDGRQLVTGSYDHTVRTWRALDGRSQQVLRGHTATVYGAAFVAGRKKRVVSSSSDGTIRLWDLTTGRARTVGRHQGRAYQLDADPTGLQVLVAGSDRTARIWSLESTVAGAVTTLSGHRGELRSVRYSRDGASLATTSVDGTLRLWSRDGRPRWRVLPMRPARAPQAQLRSWGAGATAQARLPADSRCSGGAFAVGYRTGRIELRCPGSAGPQRALDDLPACAVEQLVLGPRGTLVAGSACGALGLWSVETGKRLATARLHGPVVQLSVKGGEIHAATEIGARLTWKLQLLLQPRCTVLESVWREVPVTWESGQAVVRAPQAPTRADKQLNLNSLNLVFICLDGRKIPRRASYGQVGVRTRPCVMPTQHHRPTGSKRSACWSPTWRPT